jgi:hypothetical protein
VRAVLVSAPIISSASMSSLRSGILEKDEISLANSWSLMVQLEMNMVWKGG